MNEKIQTEKGSKEFYDLSKDYELAFAVMNLISVEEHLAFTIARSRDEKYIDIYNEVRKLRSKYMKKIVKNSDGEMWCVSKHLLSVSMRLIETGVKYSAEDDKESAMNLFSDATDVFQLFWLIQKIGSKDNKGEKNVNVKKSKKQDSRG